MRKEYDFSKSHKNPYAKSLKKQMIIRVKDVYDSVFSDEKICREQLDTAAWFEGAGVNEGQKW